MVAQHVYDRRRRHTHARHHWRRGSPTARRVGAPALPDPARLAYTGPDGYPRVIPIGFLWNGTAVVVCTAPTAPKVAALAKQPHVALTIDTMGPPAKELLLRGTASIEIVDGVPPEYLAAAAKSTQGDELAAFEAGVRGLYKEMARITITPLMGALL